MRHTGCWMGPLKGAREPESTWARFNLGEALGWGSPKKEFKGHIPVPFVRHGAPRVYKAKYQREMTDEELASMRQRWPDMPSPSFFNVVEPIQARFRTDALQSLQSEADRVLLSPPTLRRTTQNEPSLGLGAK